MWGRLVSLGVDLSAASGIHRYQPPKGFPLPLDLYLGEARSSSASQKIFQNKSEWSKASEFQYSESKSEAGDKDRGKCGT